MQSHFVRGSKNLAEDPDYAGVLTDLKAKLKAFQKETNDPWVVKTGRIKIKNPLALPSNVVTHLTPAATRV